MKQRCLNPNNKTYYRYGGVGKGVCDEWLEFLPFRDWALANGFEEGLTLDRIENSKGYSPENCRWATMGEQHRNKDSNLKAPDGRLWIDIAEENGTGRVRFQSRRAIGWDLEWAATAPKGATRRTHTTDGEPVFVAPVHKRQKSGSKQRTDH